MRRVLLEQAARIREAPKEHLAEARDVLAAFVPRVEFRPIGDGSVPDGICPSGAAFVVEGRAA